MSAAAAQRAVKQTPLDKDQNKDGMPVIVMRAVENGRAALERGDPDKAVKMLVNADVLCQKCEAPPTIHGLCLRSLSDAMATGGDLDGAREPLERGIALCKKFEGRAGMPEVMARDLNGRLGDLHSALGELERTVGNMKQGVQNLRKGADYISRLGQPELHAAALNRVGFCLLAKQEPKLALDELDEAEGIINQVRPQEEALEHGPFLLAATKAHQGQAKAMQGDLAAARALLEEAVVLGGQTGNGDAAEQAAAQLEALNGGGQEKKQETQVDESAFL